MTPIRAFAGIFTLALSIASPALACEQAGCTEFPADAGFLNVRDFGAKGDGVHDDTAAINAALTASGGDTGATFWQDRLVYFPDGTYLVSSPIVKRYADGRFASGAILIGQSRAGTVLKLKDTAPGYDDASHPQAIVFTASKLLDSAAGRDYAGKGEGNDAYMNFVENLTVDAGSGNPGAIGIDYLANNMGAIRNVLVRAGDGSGATGIALTRKWPGPALLENVTVEGFATGIEADQTEYGVTLESIHLTGQRQMGLRNDHNMLAIHDLTVSGAPLSIANLSPDGLIVIEDGTFGTIDNKGYMTMSGQASGAGIYQARWSLPVKNPPQDFAEPAAQWKSVQAFGAVPDSGKDATEAIRKAFASGAHTLYFPHGRYLINGTIDIPAGVRRIVGMTSTIYADANRSPEFRRDRGMLRATNDAPLLIEKLAFDNSNLGDQVAIEAAGKGPIILRDVVGAGVTTLSRTQNGGEAFVEDTCCGTMSLAGKKGVWMRQLNSEGEGVRIENNGTPLWILGLKTEQDCTVIDNKSGAQTEVVGGLLYITGNSADPRIPAFRNSDSHLLLSYVEESFHPAATYRTHVIDQEKGQIHTIEAEALPQRNAGRVAPLIGQ